jgi:hypothetical protein
MAYENTLVSQRQGGAALDVKSGGKIVVHSGGKIIASSNTSLPVIADVSGGSTVDAEARTAVNTLLAELRDLGILGAS